MPDGQEFPVDATISRNEPAIDGELRPSSWPRCATEPGTGIARRSEALGKRFRTVLDLSPVAMWITDGDHVVSPTAPPSNFSACALATTRRPFGVHAAAP
ncbi:MAG: hypothetical protein IPK42_13915 [Betaproteobacteria bacterium]|nr:hypothetical protein [Betaproteobacteria bacterium]